MLGSFSCDDMYMRKSDTTTSTTAGSVLGWPVACLDLMPPPHCYCHMLLPCNQHHPM
jgi:hypothetical protein